MASIGKDRSPSYISAARGTFSTSTPASDKHSDENKEKLVGPGSEGMDFVRAVKEIGDQGSDPKNFAMWERRLGQGGSYGLPDFIEKWNADKFQKVGIGLGVLSVASF